MPTLIIETKINVAPEVCFDLVRDASLQRQFSKGTSAETHGEIELGEIVAFENKFLGFSQKLKVRVVALDKPSGFTDEMIEGNFKSFKHVHEFVPETVKR